MPQNYEIQYTREATDAFIQIASDFVVLCDVLHHRTTTVNNTRNLTFLSLDIPLSSIRMHSTLPFLPFEYVNHTHKHHSHLRLRKPFSFYHPLSPENRPSLKLYRRVSHPKEFHPLAKRQACVETAHIQRTFHCVSNELKESSPEKFPFLSRPSH